MENTRPENGYAKFRSGKGFTVVLIAIMVVWLLVNFALYRFDPGLSFFNVFLSMEASLSFPLLMIRQEHIKKEQDSIQEKQLKYMQHLMEATLALVAERVPQDGQIADTVAQAPDGT